MFNTLRVIGKTALPKLLVGSMAATIIQQSKMSKKVSGKVTELNGFIPHTRATIIISSKHIKL